MSAVQPTCPPSLQHICSTGRSSSHSGYPHTPLHLWALVGCMWQAPAAALGAQGVRGDLNEQHPCKEGRHNKAAALAAYQLPSTACCVSDPSAQPSAASRKTAAVPAIIGHAPRLNMSAASVQRWPISCSGAAAGRAKWAPCRNVNSNVSSNPQEATQARHCSA